MQGSQNWGFLGFPHSLTCANSNTSNISFNTTRNIYIDYFLIVWNLQDLQEIYNHECNIKTRTTNLI